MGSSTMKHVAISEPVRRLWSFVPSGGSLPEDVWENRHRFLLGLTWFHAVIIASVGPLLGYRWELSLEALFHDGTAIHTAGEGLIVAIFAALAGWKGASRTFQATTVGFGLMSSSAILVHLSGGYIELHFHFFVMLVFLALYQDWIPYILAIVYVAIHHGVVGVLWPQEVYNHAAAFNAPWTWAGIHAFFVLWASVGSVIAWRFNEIAFQETEQRAHEQAALNAIAMATAQSLHLDQLLQISLDRVLEVTGREQGYIRLKDPVTGDLRLVAHRGISKEYIEVLLHRRTPGGKADQVFESGEALVINDPEKVTLKEETRREGRRAMSWFPLMVRGRAVGIMNVSTTRSIPFQPREVELLKAVGNVIGVALENVRLFQETEQRARQQEALNEIATATSQLLDLKELFEIALDKTVKVTGRPRISFRLKDPRTGSVNLVASRGLSEEEIEELRRQKEHPMIDKVLTSGRPEIVNDTGENHSPGVLGQTRSVAWVPVKAGAKIVGILDISDNQSKPFSPSEVKLLLAIGSVIGVAIENARLFEQVMVSKEELEKVNNTLAQQARELTRSNTELQQFAYVASHDLQEPLRMVASYVQLLAKRYKGKLDSDADEFISYAVDGANRMQGLIRALLTYSRVGTRGKDFEPTDCEAVLDSTLADLRAAIEESGAVVTHDPLPTVVADGLQLGQLFQNLVGNAIKFRNQRSPVVHVSAKRNGGEWIFSVRDNGIGIEAEHFERIFIIFQRLHGKGEYPGTGIGLAVCKKIVERHGGKVWVESEVGKGATFYFTMPA